MARVSGAKISSIEKVLAKYVFRQFYKTFFPVRWHLHYLRMPSKCQQNATASNSRYTDVKPIGIVYYCCGVTAEGILKDPFLGPAL